MNFKEAFEEAAMMMEQDAGLTVSSEQEVLDNLETVVPEIQTEDSGYDANDLEPDDSEFEDEDVDDEDEDESDFEEDLESDEDEDEEDEDEL